MSTKKVKSAGRFGSRYGVGIRKRVVGIETQQKAKHTCPACHFPKVKRLSRGIFRCNKCSHKFAGGTYLPVTLTGSIIRKMVTQKGFASYQAQLLEVKEKAMEAELAEAVEEAEEKEEEKVKGSRKKSSVKKKSAQKSKSKKK